MEIVDVYENVQCESFIDLNRIRVRTIGNSAVPDGIFIACSKTIREQYPVRTIFQAESAVVIKIVDSRTHMRAKDHIIFPVS